MYSSRVDARFAESPPEQTVTYTIWHNGRLVGESDLAFQRWRDDFRTGWFFATEYGQTLGDVIAAVQRVFDAMRTRDTAIFSQVFDSSARLVGVSNRGGTPALSLTTPAQFAASIGRAPAGDVWNERIFDPEVRIDGDLAQVWAYYTFHRNKTFSHCGIDAVMLRKVGGAWKITQLADTRRTQGCAHTEPPDLYKEIRLRSIFP